MALIEELGPGVRLRGLVVGEVVEIISVVAHNDTIELIVRASAGIEERLITRADLESMDVVAVLAGRYTRGRDTDAGIAGPGRGRRGGRSAYRAHNYDTHREERRHHHYGAGAVHAAGLVR